MMVGLLAIFVSSCGESDRMSKENVNAFEDAAVLADLGSPKSQYNLGVFYENGIGVEKNKVRAVSWYRKAAQNGVAEAQYNLACHLEVGEGVLKDQIEAYAYFNLAGIHLEVSREARDRLEGKMSPEAVLRGQQRSKDLGKEIAAKMAAEKVVK
jgi:TPR repeat protein